MIADQWDVSRDDLDASPPRVTTRARRPPKVVEREIVPIYVRDEEGQPPTS